MNQRLAKRVKFDNLQNRNEIRSPIFSDKKLENPLELFQASENRRYNFCIILHIREVV